MKLSMGLAEKGEKPEQRLPTVSLDGIAEYIKSGKCKNIITMAGAGISTCKYIFKNKILNLLFAGLEKPGS